MMQMTWIWFFVVNICFALALAALWTNYLGWRKSKRQNREREEIDPNNVPKFTPTWQTRRAPRL
jgi:hypothetical protein